MKPSGGRDAEDAEGEVDEMRSVWRAMRDEEPPARGLEALMAAAGAKAAEMRAARAHDETRQDVPPADDAAPSDRGLDVLMAAARAGAVRGGGRSAEAPAAFAAGSRAPVDEPLDASERSASVSRAVGEIRIGPRAEAPAVRTPVWRALAVTLRRPPVLAFASVLILVGGALVATHHAGDKPSAPSMTAVPRAQPPAAEPIGADGADASPADAKQTPAVPAPARAKDGAASPAALSEQAAAAARRGDCAEARRLLERLDAPSRAQAARR
ncbi:MAG TPA: hypothetical protein VFP84_33395, partial [Kofleriaceae bacterium]|nr:hypothetical protein [Kofleriaceae bacterium]